MTMTIGRGRWRGLFLLSLFASTSCAASILPSAASSSFPQCGLSCTVLTQAQSSCETGAESTWVSCFCQSALLTTLKTSGSLCTSCTSPSDQSLLSSWYTNYCNSNGKDTGSSDSTSSTTSAATTTNSAATASATATKSTSGQSSTQSQKSWWSSHYQWVIMLIVLAIGFGIIAAVGVWLKRRYDAKRPGLYHAGSATASSSGVLGGNSSSGSALSPPQPAWAASPGPNQSQSFASSSRSEIAPRAAGAPASSSRTHLPKPAQNLGDVEIRQVSLQ